MAHTLESFAAAAHDILTADPGPAGRERLRALVEEVLTRNVEAGARSLKFAWAYDRSLAVGPGDRTTAARAMGRRPEALDGAHRAAFSDHLIRFWLDRARDLGLVVQVHTGMGRLRGSDPTLLDPLLA